MSLTGSQPAECNKEMWGAGATKRKGSADAFLRGEGEVR